MGFDKPRLTAERASLVLLLVATGCSEFRLGEHDVEPTTDSGATDTSETGGVHSVTVVHHLRADFDTTIHVAGVDGAFLLSLPADPSGITLVEGVVPGGFVSVVEDGVPEGSPPLTQVRTIAGVQPGDTLHFATPSASRTYAGAVAAAEPPVPVDSLHLDACGLTSFHGDTSTWPVPMDFEPPFGPYTLCADRYGRYPVRVHGRDEGDEPVVMAFVDDLGSDAEPLDVVVDNWQPVERTLETTYHNDTSAPDPLTSARASALRGGVRYELLAGPFPADETAPGGTSTSGRLGIDPRFDEQVEAMLQRDDGDPTSFERTLRAHTLDVASLPGSVTVPFSTGDLPASVEAVGWSDGLHGVVALPDGDLNCEGAPHRAHYTFYGATPKGERRELWWQLRSEGEVRFPELGPDLSDRWIAPSDAATTTFGVERLASDVGYAQIRTSPRAVQSAFAYGPAQALEPAPRVLCSSTRYEWGP